MVTWSLNLLAIEPDLAYLASLHEEIQPKIRFLKWFPLLYLSAQMQPLPYGGVVKNSRNFFLQSFLVGHLDWNWYFKIEWIWISKELALPIAVFPPAEIIVQWMKCGLLKIGLTCWGTLFTLNFSVRELKIAGHWVSSLISGKVSNVFRHVVFSQKKVIVIDLQHQDVFHNQIVHSKM